MGICAGESICKFHKEIGSNGAMAPSQRTESEPTMQRLYDRIWLLAAAALLFFALSYVAWGWIDVFSVPMG
ncbi:hypothetical protein Natpe_2373 [Natrinema pellirubrum DSM 15624]|uniref:Uncharacterized protein n=2 Tax=Natrinema pellirubrum (strain DSM 15624 / CIP 106293 / JCM 10476 / NCIMB 786 / 157) TaxID=797303 RepID=L0JLN2_NATP1|nr:hypothetical protein Natpe_2373 [Natrinema pellirubrum DSM 15624]